MDEPLIDCHVHVFDPGRFPYAPDAYYIPTGPETGTVEQLRRTHDVHGVRYALLVGPNSGYGEDNRYLLDAVAGGAGRFRGEAVVPNRATPTELSGLRDAGVCGVTLNAALLGVVTTPIRGNCSRRQLTRAWSPTCRSNATNSQPSPGC